MKLPFALVLFFLAGCVSHRAVIPDHADPEIRPDRFDHARRDSIQQIIESDKTNLLGRSLEEVSQLLGLADMP
jgi:hypothetical protein